METDNLFYFIRILKISNFFRPFRAKNIYQALNKPDPL
jgi:hypothetical protein